MRSRWLPYGVLLAVSAALCCIQLVLVAVRDFGAEEPPLDAAIAGTDQVHEP